VLKAQGQTLCCLASHFQSYLFTHPVFGVAKLSLKKMDLNTACAKRLEKMSSLLFLCELTGLFKLHGSTQSWHAAMEENTICAYGNLYSR
jgi:hypothetical protein